MLASIWALKGGQGTSTTAALAAVGASADRPALLVDLCGDQSSLFRVDRRREGIAEWSSGDLTTRALRHQEVHVTDTLRLLPRGRGPIDPRRTQELLEWLVGSGQVEAVIADAGTLDPEGGGEARDYQLRRTVAQIAVVSVLVTRPCYLSLRRCELNTVSPTGVVMVSDGRRALGPADIEQATGAPVLATVPQDLQIALAADGGDIAEQAWTNTVQQLRGLVVPAVNRIKQQGLEAAATEPKQWCSWWDRDTRRQFLAAASWATESEWGEHEIDEETGRIWIGGVDDDKDLIATAKVCTTLKPRDWRYYLHRNIYRLLESDFANELLHSQHLQAAGRGDGLGL